MTDFSHRHPVRPALARARRRVICALALGLCLAVSAPRAQETLSSVQRELDRVEREIGREQELHKAERARAAEFEKQKNARLQALQEQIKAADARIDSLKQRMEVERQRRTSQRGLAAQYVARQKAFRVNLDKEIKSMIAWVESDFPYQRERRASEWRELAEANREATIPVEEVLVRLFGLTQASLDFAGNSEAYPGTYTTAKGDTHEGFYIRLGAVTMAFSSTDGKQQAYLAKTPAGYVWRDEDLAGDIKGSIRSAVSVAQGREAPRLVPLPVEISVANGGSK
jgi:TolA-binding protein